MYRCFKCMCTQRTSLQARPELCKEKASSPLGMLAAHQQVARAHFEPQPPALLENSFLSQARVCMKRYVPVLCSLEGKPTDDQAEQVTQVRACAQISKHFLQKPARWGAFELKSSNCHSIPQGCRTMLSELRPLRVAMC